MNSFFVYQPETFRTINFVFGWMIGPWPAVWIFGALFVIAVIGGLLAARKNPHLFGTIVLVAATIAWLPLFAQFLYNSFREAKATEVALGAPEREQIIWRYCRMDKYQNLGGGPCGLYPYVEEIRKQIPAGSSLAVMTAIWSPYFSYYLYNSYNFAPATEADYIVIYRPLQEFHYKNSKLYLSDKEQGIENELLGTFEEVARFEFDRIIYKRIR